MTLHVVTDVADHFSIKNNILDIVSQYHIVHVTIEFEPIDSICTTDCDCL